MAAFPPPVSEYDRILGRLVCDRLGLDPARVRADGLSFDHVTGKTVFVTAVTMTTLPAEDLLELQAIAHRRFMAAGPLG